MKDILKSHYGLLNITVVFSVISSAAILGIPFLSEDCRDGIEVNYIIPTIFWIFLIGEQIVFKMFSKGVNKEFQKKKPSGFRFPGCFLFFRSPFGKKCDIVFIASTLIVVILIIVQKSDSVIQYIMLFMMVLSFRFHSIFNGRAYLLLKRKGKLKGSGKRVEAE